MNEEQLDRLIVVLESIDSNLVEISASLDNLSQNLQDCTFEDERGRGFLHVGGTIVNYKY